MNCRIGFLGLVLLAPGCVHPLLTRSQSDEEGERDKAAQLQTVGDCTSIANADPIQVYGVGLVVGLDGTGGGAPPGGYREVVEKRLKQKGLENYKDILASKDTSLVLVQGLIPAGAHKGDAIDLTVTLPPEVRTTSLRGGRLVDCELFNYESASGVVAGYGGGDRDLKGHPLVRAQGPLVVGFGDGDDAANLRRACIWGGGRCMIDRPFFLVLGDNHQYARVARQIEQRINETFQGAFPQAPGMEIAKAKTKSVVVLGVPHQYKHNLPRYLRVVRMVPLEELPPPGSPYRLKLQEELLDPAQTVTAALRLEALGPDTAPILKQGLKNHQPLVQFTSAEALAYLGDPSCGEVLARLVEEQPALRAYCLTAMASLDESVCHIKLEELLSSPSAEARYGAFRALRVLQEKDRTSVVQGKLVNDSFWIHRVAAESPGLVHISSSRRPEIVLFGEMATLRPPFRFLAGTEFTVTTGKEDDRCTISRFSTQQGKQWKQAALRLDEILFTMASMGATYPDVVEFLRQADRHGCMSCAVRNDALPQAATVQELARAGKHNPDFLKQEIVQARSDFNLTPTLYETDAAFGLGNRPSDKIKEDAEALLRKPAVKDGKKTASK